MSDIKTPKYSFLELISMSFSVCVGLGIFIISVQVLGKLQKETIGNFVYLALIIGAIPAFFSAFIAGVSSSIWPSYGGDYTYLTRKVSPFWGAINTWGYWFVIPMQLQGAAITGTVILAQLFKLMGFLELSNFIIDNLLVVSTILMGISFFVNYTGMEGKATLITSGITLVLLLLFTYYAIGHNYNDFLSTIESQESLIKILENSNYPPITWKGLLMGIAILMFSYGGVTFTQNAGAEIHTEVRRKIWKVIIIALTLATIFYIIVSYVLYNAVPWQYIYIKVGINKDFTAIDALSIYMPASVYAFITFLLFVAVFDNMFMLGFRSARHGYAVSIDGFFNKVKGLTYVSRTFSTPVVQLVIVYTIAFLILIFITNPVLGFYANFSYSFGLLVTSYMPFKIREEELSNIFPKNTRNILKLMRIMGVISMLVYLIILIGLYYTVIKMAAFWTAVMGIGWLFYYIEMYRKCRTINRSRPHQ
ncbi:MAG: APC family permease [bacterium]